MHEEDKLTQPEGTEESGVGLTGVSPTPNPPNPGTIILTCTLYLEVEVDGDPSEPTNQKRIDAAKADIWSLLEGHNCSGIMDERTALDWDADWEEVDNDQ